MRKSKNKILLEYIENVIRNNPYLANAVYRWISRTGLFNIKSVEDQLFKQGKIKKHKQTAQKSSSVLVDDEAPLSEYSVPMELYPEIILKVCQQDKKTTPSDSVFEKRLEWLRQIIHLTAGEFAVVRFYAYIKRSTVLNLFVNNTLLVARNVRPHFSLYDCPEIISMNEKQIQQALSRNGRLYKSGLLSEEFRDELSLNKTVYEFLTMPLKSKEEFRQLLVGKIQHGLIPLSEYPFWEQTPTYLKTLLKNALKNKTKGIHLLFYGAPGTGKTEFAKSLADALGKNLYSIGEPKDREPCRAERFGSLKLADFILGNTQSLLLFDEAEDLFRNSMFGTESGSKVYMNRFLEENMHPILWTTNNIHSMDPAFLRRFTYIVEFKKPTTSIRQKMWEKELNKTDLILDSKEVILLAKNYDIPPAMIHSVVQSASLAHGSISDIKNTLACFEKALGQKYQQSAQNVDSFNADLLNTDTDMKNLADRLCLLGNRHFSLCLYGAPGTGKSAYARYIAARLNMDVVEKKASDLLGRYVGESEKNIAEAFEEAKQKKALLIFDEADSFLSDRAHAEHSWEVSQVNEMLTWMESHPYPFVCTTNLMDNLDKACLRRFTFKIKYNYLNSAQIEKAFEHFFGQVPTKEKIQILNFLSPGDFVVVKKKAEILGYMDDTDELISMLQKEAEVKNEKKCSHKIGFI